MDIRDVEMYLQEYFFNPDIERTSRQLVNEIKDKTCTLYTSGMLGDITPENLGLSIHCIDYPSLENILDNHVEHGISQNIQGAPEQEVENPGRRLSRVSIIPFMEDGIVKFNLRLKSLPSVVIDGKILYRYFQKEVYYTKVIEDSSVIEAIDRIANNGNKIRNLYLSEFKLKPRKPVKSSRARAPIR